MITGQVLLVVLIVAGGYYGSREAMRGVKHVGHAIVHVFKKPKPNPSGPITGNPNTGILTDADAKADPK
jgi:hypothetical protein